MESKNGRTDVDLGSAEAAKRASFVFGPRSPSAATLSIIECTASVLFITAVNSDNRYCNNNKAIPLCPAVSFASTIRVQCFQVPWKSKLPRRGAVMRWRLHVRDSRNSFISPINFVISETSCSQARACTQSLFRRANLLINLKIIFASMTSFLNFHDEQ